MKNHQKGFIGIALLIVLGLLIVGGGAYYYHTKESAKVADSSAVSLDNDSGGSVKLNDYSNLDTKTNANTVVNTKSSTITVSNSSNANTDKVYENSYFKITIPKDWIAAEATRTENIGTCSPDKTNCTISQKIEPNPAAVNITKGNYILYINAATNQASGVDGGRFAEIAMGAPSVDAVVSDQPNFCGYEETTSLISEYKRHDIYVSKDKGQLNSGCHPPKIGAAWYFSYVSKDGGYFNTYSNFTGPNGNIYQYVITMASKISNVDALPQKDYADFNQALKEMSSILDTLQLKHS